MASNAQWVDTYLQGQGLSPGASAGAVGNLIAESGVSPASVQSGGPGRGIAQWSLGGRWNTFLAWAKSRGLAPLSLQTQTRFLVEEMKSMGVWSQLLATNDPVTAADIVMRRYEMPADQSAANASRRAILGVKAVGGTVATAQNGGGYFGAASGQAEPFPTLGPSWLPWNIPADIGNSAAAAGQQGLLSGVNHIVLQGAFIGLAVILVGAGLWKIVSPTVQRGVDRAAKLAPLAAL